ncbi:MAG TPA: Mur ligase family protein [Thermoanaerobaculia bacterium]|nr:Mur ligase family protein [Thermoanaerobaculia bacterium]
MAPRHPARQERLERPVRLALQPSRRLTGFNLLSPRPGAVLDVGLGGTEAESEALIGAWRRQARRMLDALGWQDEEVAVRRFGGGASLFLSAPIDALYAATEVNDWAWEAAVEAAGGAGGMVGGTGETGSAGGGGGAVEAGGSGAAGSGRGGGAGEAGGTGAAGSGAAGSGAAAFAAAAERLRSAAARESNPALLALRAAAAARGVAFLADDDEVTVGLGAGSRTWPRGELPPPGAVDWAAVHDVPVALVTGTNGKTTTVRLTAAMLAAAGRVAGVTSTDLIAVGGAVLDVGDYSGPGGARTLLRDRRVQAAVLETARGGLLRRGLALDRVTAAAVTNIAADHLGEYGVEDLAGLAEAKLLVTRAVVPAGRAVLNADDPELAARGSRAGRGSAPVTWTSLAPSQPAAGLDLAAHLAAGGDAVLLDGDRLVLVREGRREVVAAVGDVPIAFGGAARHNLANALAAIGLASAFGLPVAAMAEGLAAIRDERDNPGRGYLAEIDGFHVLLDYAHNPHGLAALIALAESLPARRRLLILGQAGDRDDEAIRDLARAAWRLRPDRVIVKELPTMLRGRLPGQVTAVLEDELLKLGARRQDLGHAATELEAVQQALDWARPGDLLVLLVHTQREDALELLRRRGGRR